MRFSPYHDNAKEWKLDLEPVEAYSHIYPPYLNQHYDIAYYFKLKSIKEAENHPSFLSEHHFECNKAINEWISYWRDRQKKGKKQPKLILIENKKNQAVIVDERSSSGNIINTIVSSGIKSLLIHCRTRRTYSSLWDYKSDSKWKSPSANDLLLLNKCLENSWLIKIGNQYLSLVQHRNEEQLPYSCWPGGQIIKSNEKVDCN